jgi:hypothetical protein
MIAFRASFCAHRAFWRAGIHGLTYAVLPWAVNTTLLSGSGLALDPSEVLAPEYVAGNIFEAAKGKKKTGYLFEVYPLWVTVKKRDESEQDVSEWFFALIFRYTARLRKTTAHASFDIFPEAIRIMASYSFSPGSEMPTPLSSKKTSAEASAVLLLPSTKG